DWVLGDDQCSSQARGVPLFWDKQQNSPPYLHALLFADRFRPPDRRELPRPCKRLYRQGRPPRDTLVGNRPDRSERRVVGGRAPQRQTDGEKPDALAQSLATAEAAPQAHH